MTTTPTGVPIVDCPSCGRRHPITREHCDQCGMPTTFPCGGDPDCPRLGEQRPATVSAQPASAPPVDLLQMLADLDTAPPVLHALMPWMDSACGRVCACGGCGSCPCGNRCLTQPKPAFATRYADVTCPDCLATGDLPALGAAAQRPGGGGA